MIFPPPPIRLIGFGDALYTSYVGGGSFGGRRICKGKEQEGGLKRGNYGDAMRIHTTGEAGSGGVPWG
jgi:hypothetical protein